jgi:hypothetical protein
MHLTKTIQGKVAHTLTTIKHSVEKKLRLQYYRYLYRQKTIKSLVTAQAKYAIVNLGAQLRFDDHSRYFYTICTYLEKAGFIVVVKTELRDFQASKKKNYHTHVWERNYIFVRNCATPPNTIMLVQPDGANHIIRFSFSYSIIRNRPLHQLIKTGEFDCVAPYPMHPFQNKYYADPSFSQLLNSSKRTIKIFFAGRTIGLVNKEQYANERIKTFFNVIPRIELLKLILLHFKDCSKSLNKESDKAVLADLINTDNCVNEIVISQVKTEEKDWLKILSKADFFICAPGARMPWCHNCVEAMAAGAIPILEYAHLFFPELQNRKNCLSFSNEEELQDAIKTALAMDTEAIEAMRKNVLEYYDRFLSIASITKKLNEFSNSKKLELKVAVPFVPTHEERRCIDN